MRTICLNFIVYLKICRLWNGITQDGKIHVNGTNLTIPKYS